MLGSGRLGRCQAQAAFELRPPVDPAPAVPASLKAALLAPDLAHQARRPGTFVAELGKAPRAQVLLLLPPALESVQAAGLGLATMLAGNAHLSA